MRNPKDLKHDIIFLITIEYAQGRFVGFTWLFLLLTGGCDSKNVDRALLYLPRNNE